MARRGSKALPRGWRVFIAAPCAFWLSTCGGGRTSTSTTPNAAPTTTPSTTQPAAPAGFPNTDPAWLHTLAPEYPYAAEVANVRVFSDLSAGFSDDHAAHLKRVWDFFNSLYARNHGNWISVYYTTDAAKFEKVVPYCPTIFIPGARNLTSCYLDYPRWFIIPYQIPDFGTQLHEIGHDFLNATWPGSEAFPWFKEGTAMYFESGSFTQGGPMTPHHPLSYCTILFSRYEQGGGLIPLDQLLNLPKSDFLADNERAYSQSCMLFHYLQDRDAGLLPAMIFRINSGTVTSNDSLKALMLTLTGMSVAEIQVAYETYARQVSQ